MRLIDADNILNDFCSYCNQEGCEGGMVGSIQECETIRMLRDVIDDTPTAYDIDKVVGELEKKKDLQERLVEYERKNGTVTEKFQHIKAIEILNESIEIVKRGGKND